jgi:hypothetical protein
VELRVDRGEAPDDGALQLRIEQLVARIRPFADLDATLQLGKMLTPFGGYAQRHHSTADPLIRPPLAYEWRTMVSSSIVPPSNDGFLGWKDDPAFFRPAGAPPIWGVPYQLGAMLALARGSLQARVAVMNSAPSSEPPAWDRFDGFERPSLLAAIAWQPIAALRVAGSYNVGAYLDPAAQARTGAEDDSYEGSVAGEYDAVTDSHDSGELEDYVQELWGVHVAYARDRLQLDGELLFDRWEVPAVREDPRETAYHLEAKLKLSAGAFIAARLGGIHYNEIARADGAREAWDYDTRRLQLGAGYAPAREWLVKAEYALTSTARLDADDNLLALQVSWRR